MDLDTAFAWVSAFALAVALAASAGLRAWLPLLITGIAIRAGALDVGASFAFLGSTPALATFVLATVIEIAGDKIPAVDHVLDAFGTYFRPIAGALLAATAFSELQNPLFSIVLGLAIGAPTALVPHAMKSVARVASSTATFGFANPLLSVLEDVASFVVVLVAIFVPIVALLLTAVLMTILWRRRRTASPRVAVAQRA